MQVSTAITDLKTNVLVVIMDFTSVVAKVISTGWYCIL